MPDDLFSSMINRQEFIPALQYKLRNLLSANHRVTRSLIDGDCGDLNASQLVVLKPLLDSEKGLCQLLDDLVEIYHYQSGDRKLKVRNYTVSHLLTRVAAEYSKRAASRSIFLSVTFPSQDKIIACDADQMVVLLGHLVGNAIDFARSVVKLEVDYQFSEKVTFVIKDDGPGIDPATSKGISLYLCDQIAKAHGGSLFYRMDEGAVFYVAMPQVSPVVDGINAEAKEK